LDIGVLDYIGILYHKEHPPEVWHIHPGTPCILLHMSIEKSITHNQHKPLANENF
jgi:hypothetical protein